MPSHRIRHHIGSNLVGYIAILAVLSSGVAYANHERIRSSDIVNGQVKRPDIGLNAVDGARVINGSLGAADIRLSCPGGMKRFGQTFCIDRAPRDFLAFLPAIERCAAAGLRLPSISEGWAAKGLLTEPGNFWTDHAYREGIDATADVAVSVERLSSGDTWLRIHDLGAGLGVRCATVPRG